MATQAEGYPFEVAVPGTVPGVVLAEQIKSLDWTARKARARALSIHSCWPKCGPRRAP